MNCSPGIKAANSEDSRFCPLTKDYHIRPESIHLSLTSGSKQMLNIMQREFKNTLLEVDFCLSANQQLPVPLLRFVDGLHSRILQKLGSETDS